MKKVIICFALFFLMVNAYAQQRPQYTQYVSNNFLINPAFAGIGKDMNIAASYRKQWVGLSGSPSTSYLTFSTPLKNDADVLNNYEDDESMLFELQAPHHALGFTVINDEAGALKRFVANGTYAYHMRISDNVNISAGLSAGLSQVTVNPHKLELEQAADPAVRNYVGNSQADINAGILFYSKRFFAGISLHQIIQPQVETNGSNVDMFGDRKFPDLFLSGGLRFNINDDIYVTPAVMLKYINTVPLTFDINSRVDYQDLFYAGVSYRYQSGMAAMAGARINKSVRIGYSYDITTSGLQTVSNGTHELLLNFTIKYPGKLL